MRLALAIAVVFAFLFFPTYGDAQKTRARVKAVRFSPRDIATRVLQSVVIIITQDENGDPISQGSGFVYRPGLIVTNLHVFERASRAVIKNVKTGEISNAVEVIGINAQQDICVVRVDNTKSPAIAVGDSRLVKTGDEIYVASNPKGLEGSFTKGIISAVREKNRVKKSEGIVDEVLRELGLLTDLTLFQLDAAISPGSSGGVLTNGRGEAIGIIKSSLVSGQNLNFAIPIEQLISLPLKFKHPIILAGACAYNDRSKAKLKGRVKTVKEIIVDRSTNAERVNALEEFDYFGNNIKSVIFGSEKAYEINREFDENGLVTSIKYIRPGLEDVSVAVKIGDAVKEKIDSRKYSGITEELNESATFDRFGNKLRSVIVTDEQSIVTEYRYDSDGQMTFSKEYRGDKVWSTRYQYRFDQFGNWIQQNREVQLRSDGDWFDPELLITREITYYQ